MKYQMNGHLGSSFRISIVNATQLKIHRFICTHFWTDNWRIKRNVTCLELKKKNNFCKIKCFFVKWERWGKSKTVKMHQSTQNSDSWQRLNFYGLRSFPNVRLVIIVGFIGIVVFNSEFGFCFPKYWKHTTILLH